MCHLSVVSAPSTSQGCFRACSPQLVINISLHAEPARDKSRKEVISQINYPTCCQCMHQFSEEEGEGQE